MIRNILFILVFCLLCLTSYDLFIYEHENVHHTINTYHGINSTITFQRFLGYRISGIVTTQEPIPPHHLSNLTLLHSQNEIIGYHCKALFLLIYIITAWFTYLQFHK